MSRKAPQRHLVRPENKKPYWRGNESGEQPERRSTDTGRSQALKSQALAVVDFPEEPFISGEGSYSASQAELSKGEVRAKKSRHLEDPWGSAVRISVNGDDNVEGVPSRVEFELYRPLLVDGDELDETDDRLQGVARLAAEQAQAPFPDSVLRRLEERFPEVNDKNGLAAGEEWIVEYGPVVATLDRYSELVQDRMADNPRSVRHASRDAIRDLLDELGFDGAVIMSEGRIVAFDSDAVRFS